MPTIDQQFIEFIVKSLVNQPDRVVVERRIDEKGVLLELTVDPEDLGRVIGRRGATAQSLRILLRALGTKNDARYNLKIVDSDGRQSAQDDAPAATPVTDDQPASPLTDEPTAEDSGKSVDTPPDESVDDHESMSIKTRQELAEYDDLDI